ncbi:maleylpyruvate isomerase family mycothiol-dependent enzyme [Microlunatus sp. Y2014]|uniref:maleylpyruvate isomerase family mycothiol-dependent enzyme n=1 Tax=Microlunatus sp. Y2014 TaxID=3418488 RepID=UPI003DA72FB3
MPAITPIPHDLSTINDLLVRATGALLGDTIAVTDEAWREASGLPDWTRGHLATHLARNADALGRLATGVLSGEPGTMYPSVESRNADIAAGADRPGLALHTDLDTSASELDTLFDTIGAEDRWDTEVTLSGGAVLGAGWLPVARLVEVTLHHVDLDIGVGLADLEPAAAGWVLRWVAFRLGGRIEQGFRLEVGGETLTCGQVTDDSPVVRGTVTELLGWLSGRSETEPEGASGISLPAL